MFSKTGLPGVWNLVSIQEEGRPEPIMGDVKVVIHPDGAYEITHWTDEQESTFTGTYMISGNRAIRLTDDGLQLEIFTFIVIGEVLTMTYPNGTMLTFEAEQGATELDS